MKLRLSLSGMVILALLLAVSGPAAASTDLSAVGPRG